MALLFSLPSLYMQHTTSALFGLALLGSIMAFAADSQRTGGAAQPLSPERAVELARGGHCDQALPVLRKAMGHMTDKDLDRRVGLAGVRCGMALNQPVEVARFLDSLNHEFPHDPEILYVATHAWSDLSMRASQELLFTAPASAQVHQLSAEALEMQGKWKEALEEYRTALRRNPDLPGLHFRIGRLILSQPQTPTTFEEAKTEMTAELRIDPGNAAAEYVLGEIAREGNDYPAAIEHFSRAAKLDAGFADAFIGLGRSLLSADRAQEAIAPLEHAEKLQPPNPAPHFYLSVAYRKLGRTEEAAREAEMHERASAAVRQSKGEVAGGILGGQSVDGKDAQAQP